MFKVVFIIYSNKGELGLISVMKINRNEYISKLEYTYNNNNNDIL